MRTHRLDLVHDRAPADPEHEPPGERPRAPRLAYMPWMDGLRAIAVLSVMAYHESLFDASGRIAHFLPAGDLGVDIFFAISGFLITTLLLTEAGDRGAIAFGAFYLRRARRLLPALLTMLVVVTACSTLFDSAAQRGRLLANVALSLSYVANWATGLMGHNMAGLGHTWSLATEEQFYLVWPLLLTALLALGVRGRKLLTVFGVIAAALVVWPQFGVSRHWSGARIAYGLDTRGAGLALGAVLGAALGHGVLPRARWVTSTRRILAVASVGVLAYLMHDTTALVSFGHHLGLDPKRLLFEEYSIASAITVLAIWELVESPAVLAHRVLSLKPLVWVGRISYGLYLWDAPVVYTFRLRNLSAHHPWLVVPIHLALAFGAAAISFHVIEIRFRRRRSDAGSPAKGRVRLSAPVRPAAV